ncbi:hypothetical protein TWF506_011398 [Arthrobotrys conoides]|uniref:RING-type domain-containing protein n=1 Tax=Arthrobotrys conoides TaxID=74498 RepID=A0AAN8RUQ2_9PEZI
MSDYSLEQKPKLKAGIPLQIVAKEKDSYTSFYTSLGESVGRNPLRIIPGQALSESDDPFVKVTCDLCGAKMWRYQALRIPQCHHINCSDCVTANVKAAIQANTTPKCCDEIPSDLIASAVQETEVEIVQYLTMIDELKSQRIVSCHNCEKRLLDGAILDDAAYCIDCDVITCIKCLQRMHQGGCGESETMTLARNSGWSVCYKCKTVVMKNGGCNHIVCRCHKNLNTDAYLQIDVEQSFVISAGTSGQPAIVEAER